MLDLKFIKENIVAVKENINARYLTADADLAVELYDRKIELIQKVDQLRQKRNENSAAMKGKLSPEERTVYIEQGKTLKELISSADAELADISGKLDEEVSRIPNMAHPDAPLGKEDKDNTEVERSGIIPEFDFKPKDHVTIGKDLDLIDFDTATRVSGSKFYYLKNEAVFLELALSRYALDILKERGFTIAITPDIAREEVAEGIGFNPRGSESNIYNLEGTGTCLIGTAEITLGGYYGGQILDGAELPVKLAGLSHCFRREAGAAGQYSKGLYRVHQFTKIEMFVITHPDKSEEMHNELLEIEKEIFKGLGIPFRVVDTCTGDLGAPAYRKYDLEAWMPGRGEAGGWGEITSASNCTDYQSRRLKVRFKEGGKNRYVHMLNGTAIAMSRGLISILENCQQKDGSILIPEKLVKYTGFDRINSR